MFKYLVILIGFCLSFNSYSEELKIGAIIHLTGDQASQGKAILEGVEIGIEDSNTNKKCGEHTLKLLVEDSMLKPRDAHLAAKRLIHEKGVKVAINSSFLESMANGKEFENSKIPVVTVWDSAPQIEEIGDYVFAIGIWSPSAGEEAAEIASNKFNAKTASIVSMENEWSISVGDVFKKRFEMLGGKILSFDTFQTNVSDFRTSLAKIISKNPEVLYSPVTDNILAFYSQVRELGFKGKIISSDIIAQEHIKLSPKIFEGILQTQVEDPNNQKTKELQKLYIDKYNKKPDQLSLTSLGYDGVQVICNAISLAGSDPILIKEQLYKIKNLQGASGLISIDDKGTSKRLEKVYEIKNGKIE